MAVCTSWRFLAWLLYVFRLLLHLAPERHPEAEKGDGQSGVIQAGLRKHWGSAKINADDLQDLFP